jgi:hypothetical protein
MMSRAHHQERIVRIFFILPLEMTQETIQETRLYMPLFHVDLHYT